MKFPQDVPVTPAKLEALRAQLSRLNIGLERVIEQAVKGGGPGGQKVNKTASGVLLRYELNGEMLVVKWTRERSHALNRFLALRELADSIEMIVSPGTSTRAKEIQKIRKQKDRRRRR
jgi:protein subunit release factor B